MKFPLAKQRVEVYDTRRPRGYARMSPLAVVAVILAGFFAGTVNAVVGSSSLITFPVLLALGFPPVVANVSNTVGLSVGNVGAVIGYRRELRGQLRRLLWLSAPAIAGAALGAVLLLFLPDLVFRAVVPGSSSSPSPWSSSSPGFRNASGSTDRRGGRAPSSPSRCS